MRLSSLSPPLSAAVQSIRWHLYHPSLSSPMHYKPIQDLVTIREADKNIPTHLKSILDDIPGILAKHHSPIIDKDDEFPSRENFVMSLSLILLGNGFPDEAHDLITPLSWPEPTYFGYGPSLYSSVDPNTISMASYIHALVHRQEAFQIGEFGMMGYKNSNYWANAALSSKGVDTIPFKSIREEVLKCAPSFGDSAVKWCNERVIDEGKQLGYDEDYWEPRALNELCAQVSKELHQNNPGSGGNVTNNQPLKDFAETASEIELRVLLKTCLDRSGYKNEECLKLSSIQGLVSQSQHYIDEAIQIHEDIAIAASRRISTAHLAAFKSNRNVTLRKVINKTDISTSMAYSAAVGIACSLLGVPGCRPITYTDYDTNHEPTTILVFLPKNEEEVRIMSATLSSLESNYYGGGSIGVADSHAILMSSCSKSIIEKDEHGMFLFRPIHNGTDETLFYPGSLNYVDRFHGLRSNTPTSVVQWSKGTVFVSDHTSKRG